MEGDTGRRFGVAQGRRRKWWRRDGPCPIPCPLGLRVPPPFPTPWTDRADTWALRFKARDPVAALISLFCLHQTPDPVFMALPASGGFQGT